MFKMSMFDNMAYQLMANKNEDMLDKTKCSVTAKNIFNYLTDKSEHISWNDTLMTNFLTLEEFEIDIKSTINDNKIYYVYYDHITGETSHYFIIIRLENQFYFLQSAVFEYSIADWLGLTTYQEINDNVYNNDEFDLLTKLKKEEEKKNFIK